MINEEGKFNNFLSNIIKLFQTYLFGLIIFFIFRLIYLLRFSPNGIIRNYAGDLPSAFLVGIKFDTLVLCYIIVLPLLLAVLISFFASQVLQRFYSGFCRYYFFILLLPVFLLLFIDQEYYTYFQSHISILVFGFLEDNTSAVLKSIWTDHPLILLITLYLILAVITFYVMKRIWVKVISFQFRIPVSMMVILTVLVFSLYIYGLRGSLGTFPLSEENAAVSGSQFVNLLPVNGIFAFKTAMKERSETQIDRTPLEILERYNKRSGNEFVSDYYDIPLDSIKKDYTDFLFKTTPKNEFLEKNKPDVVFVLMESFGGYFLNFHSTTLNLLGSLEKHIRTDYFFKNFVSSTRGSIYSLESILSNSTGWPLFSNSPKRFVPQKSSVAYPFKNAGYETIFITADKINWRHLNELLPNLYFDRLIGSSVICKDFPEAVEKTWGVADEYLYKEILKLLNEESSKPKLICAFTTINHTPYEIPSAYKGYPVNIPDSLYKIIIANKEIAQLVFRSYQYSCNSLGEFMTAIKSCPLADSTIVAATGDHNSYTLFPFEADQTNPVDKHGVPLYLYMPEIYKQNKNADVNRAGSHKDIFPTIIPNALSNQRYFCVGENLLGPEDSSKIYFGDNGNLIYSLPESPREKVEKKSMARRQLLEYYFSDYYLKNKVNQPLKTISSKTE